MKMPNIFDAAVANWLEAGAPMAAFQAAIYDPGPTNKVSPSRIGGCVQAHAFHKTAVPQTNPEVRETSDNLRLMMGHITQWKWYNILKYAAHPPIVEMQYEVPYETQDVAGHIDILLTLTTEVGPWQVPIEIKNTQRRLANEYMWQAAVYAQAFGECILILDRNGGDYDLVSVRRNDSENAWLAFDMRKGWPFTNRKQTYMLSDQEIDARIIQVQERMQERDLPPYTYPKLKTCLFQNGDWRPCPWFGHCWGEYHMVLDGTVITSTGTWPITE